MNWAAAKNDFIAADVIRWTEPVWKTRRSKKAKGLKVGTSQLIAEVLKDEGGWNAQTLCRLTGIVTHGGIAALHI